LVDDLVWRGGDGAGFSFATQAFQSSIQSVQWVPMDALDNCVFVAPSTGHGHRDGAGITVHGDASMINANYAVRSISPGSITTKRE
jgi:hypothetical protein